MITIDRNASAPVHEQLVAQIRFLIASGHYQVGATLPSTRALGKQVGLSFHTVRKAYQTLEREGLVEAQTGSGYIVCEPVPLTKSERMERGASVVQEALKRLVGLGLQPSEVDYLVQEQLDVLEGRRHDLKLVFAAPYREMAELCAEQVMLAVQRSVESATYAELSRHLDADFVFAPYTDVQDVMEQVPRADVRGMLSYLRPQALGAVARLLEHETLGLVTRYADAIPPLMRELRALSGFGGQVLAASIDESARHFKQLVGETDLIVYTPRSRRRLLPLLAEGPRHVEVAPVLSRESIEAVRASVAT